MSDTPVIVDWIKRLEQRMAALEEQNVKLIAAVARLAPHEPKYALAAASAEHPQHPKEEIYFTPDGAIHKL